MSKEILQLSLFNNSLERYLLSVAVFIITMIALKLFDSIFLNLLRAKAEKTSGRFDDILTRTLHYTLMPIFYYAAFYAAARSLSLTPALSRGIDFLGVTILTVTCIRFLIAITDHTLGSTLLQPDNTEKERKLKAVTPILKVTLWVIGTIFLLDNLGFQISAIVAGLGVGGIAVALAAQAILGDLFSYVAIVLDRPFELGDFIIIGEHMGTIEHVGIKTTRVRSLSGEQLVISNSDLTKSRVSNFKRMTRRRVVFRFGVIYATSGDQLEQIPDIVRRIIESVPGTTFERAHFFAFGDYSLDFEIVYYVNENDYNLYMDTQQAINLNIKKEFALQGIEFAYPSQTLFLQK